MARQVNVRVEEKSIQKVNKWGILAATQLGGFTVILNNSLMNVALPYFMNYYQITTVQTQWIVTIFALGMALTTPLTGYIGNKFGHKKVFILGMSFFVFSSLLGTFSSTFFLIIISRFLQGLGGGIVMPLSMILVFKYFPKNERGLAMGIWGISAMIAPAIGPALGGFILSFYHWPMLFIINIPTSVIALITASYYLKKSKGLEKNTFDILGYSLITIGIVSFLFGIERLQSGMPHYFAWGVLGIGGISLYFFVKNEIKVKSPLLNIRVFKNKVFSIGLLITTCSTISFFTILILIPLLMQEVLLKSPLFTGLILFPQAIAIGIAMTIGGRLLDQKGAFIVLSTGIILLTFSLFSLSFWVGKVPIWIIVLLLIFQGIGNGFINTPSVTMSLNSLRENNVNDGSAIISIFRQIVKILSVVVISIIFEWRREVYIVDVSKQEAGILAIKQSLAFTGTFIAIVLVVLLILRKKIK
ncbi:DHA2 family efflux MFS transporter permease subunit [Oceanobacillus halophilus]|uniref:DHA2 family efflux MFS transporter permease subunit n=1 Tax=Oceanobacillus halophilus TaxID=930130 RepID=A0A495ABB7_9BACI|nr:DHA2 family efflux MFS transporter permease subunit [Oceanobacillus halophilus]RKQ35726.1 DHA2 family efflux MFS transporter permease subunit [Oceanobacillus halophilus]